MGRKGSGRRGRWRGIWSVAIKERFLALLRESGNVAATLRVVGHASMFWKRRRRDAGFAAEWAEAVAAADARHRGAESRFVSPAHPRPSPATGPPPGRTPEAPNAQAGGEDMVDRLGGFAKADPATLLRPGPKRKPKARGHVIRRARGGRVQVALARECEMTAEQEAEFLARLRATGNFSGSARAMGFQPNSLFERARAWPAFAKACEDAATEASIKLDYALVAHAHKLLRTDGGEGMGRGASGWPPEEVPFDPDRAMRILAFLDRRRGGGMRRGPRKGPPERGIDEAVASVLGKIAAIERHEAMMKARSGEDCGGAAPPRHSREGGGPD